MSAHAVFRNSRSKIDATPTGIVLAAGAVVLIIAGLVAAAVRRQARDAGSFVIGLAVDQARRSTVADVVYVLLTLALFGALYAAVKGAERL